MRSCATSASTAPRTTPRRPSGWPRRASARATTCAWWPRAAAQGRLVEAFEKYREFGELAGKQELISVVDEPAVKAAPDVWSQGRIAAMVARAKPEHRK